MKRYIFLFFGIFLFILHLICSPLPKGAFKMVKQEIRNLFLSFKINRENIIIDKNGNEYFILSSGFNFDKNHAKFIFGINKNYYIFESEYGLYFCLFDYKRHLFFKEENLEELNKLVDSIPNFILFLGVSGDLTSFLNEKIEKIFKKIKVKENLKNKYGYSYIFITKKEKNKFSRVYEKISKDRAIYLKIKI